MKKLFLLLTLSSTALAVDKQIIAPTGSVVVKGNSTVKMQTYNTGAWQERFTILNNGNVGVNSTNPLNKFELMDGQLSVYNLAQTSYGAWGAAFGYLGTPSSPTQVTSGKSIAFPTYFRNGTGSYSPQGYFGWEAEQNITAADQSKFFVATGTGVKTLQVSSGGTATTSGSIVSGGMFKSSVSTCKGSTLANGATWTARSLSSNEGGMYYVWGSGGVCHGYSIGFYRFYDSIDFGASNTMGGGYNGTIPGAVTSGGAFTITNNLGCTMDDVCVNFIKMY